MVSRGEISISKWTSIWLCLLLENNQDLIKTFQTYLTGLMALLLESISNILDILANSGNTFDSPLPSHTGLLLF